METRIRFGTAIGPALLIVAAIGACLAALAGQDRADASGAALQPSPPPIGIQPSATPTRSDSSVQTRTPTPTNTRVTPTPTFTYTPSPTATPTETATPRATLPGLTILTPTPIIDVFDFPPGDLTGPIPTATPPQFAAPQQVPDLIATDMEVTQGMQSLGNHMPLAAGRLTYVRIYVETDGADYPDVRGLLQGSRGGQILGVIPADNQPILAQGSGGERINVDDSLYFALPWGWLEEGTLHLEAFVYAGNPSAPFEHEPESYNNFIQTSVNLDQAGSIRLSFVPVHLHDDYDPEQPEVLFTQQEPGFWPVVIGMLRHLPAPGFELYAPPVDKIYCHATGGSEAGVFGSLNPVGEHGDCEFNLEVPGGAEQVNNMMALMDLFTDDAAEDLHYYGMVHPDFEPDMKFYNSEGGVISYTGLAWSGQAYGSMNASPDSGSPWFLPGGMTLAHELGHRFGIKHVECSGSEEAGGGVDPNYPWPAPDCSLANIDPYGFYGFDVWHEVLPGVNGPAVISNDPSEAEPNRGFPMMGYKKHQYADAWHWCTLLDYFGVECNPDLTPFQASAGSHGLASLAQGHHLASRPVGRGLSDLELTAHLQTSQFLVASGSVQRTPLQASFGLVMTLDEPPADLRQPPEASTENTEFALVLLDSGGGILAAGPIVESNINHNVSNTVTFLSVIPLPDGVDRIEIRQADQVLAERVFSPNAPVVELLTPNGGEIFTGPFEISWQASDADGDDLSYTVQYSPDNGESWQVLAIGLTDQHYQVLSLYNLTGSEQAKIRVLASDGANTGRDETDGVFSVPNTPPMAAIQSPGHLAVFPVGGRIPLSGSATDREDGVLSPESLTWESDLDGFLGTGAKLEPANLSAGNHVLTLTAEDSDGAIGQAQVAVIVNAGWVRDNPGQDEMALASQILAAGPDWQPSESGGPEPSSLVLLALVAVAGLLGLVLFVPLVLSRLRR